MINSGKKKNFDEKITKKITKKKKKIKREKKMI